MRTSEWAAALCDEYLKPLRNRWLHSIRVACKCGALAEVVTTDAEERDLLVAAGYVHDLGYAPQLANNRFHPLDGAQFLRDAGHERLACLVAHHTGAKFEAELRGLTSDLAAFAEERSDPAAALAYADLTVGPAGQPMTPAERRADIIARYGTSGLVPQAIELAWPDLMQAVSEVQARASAPRPVSVLTAPSEVAGNRRFGGQR
jgi:hypothetical protein